MHTTDTSITDFMDHLRANAKAAPAVGIAADSVNAKTYVIYQSDPVSPGVTEITIYAPTEGELRRQMNLTIRAIERDGGMGVFHHPRRCQSGWAVIGAVHDEFA